MSRQLQWERIATLRPDNTIPPDEMPRPGEIIKITAAANFRRIARVAWCGMHGSTLQLACLDREGRLGVIILSRSEEYTIERAMIYEQRTETRWAAVVRQKEAEFVGPLYKTEEQAKFSGESYSRSSANRLLTITKVEWTEPVAPLGRPAEWADLEAAGVL